MSHESSSDSAYLDRLEFRPELRKTWLNFFVSNFRVVLLLILLISAWGLYAFFSLPRESNPEVKIPIAVVTTAFPGASPSDVEQFVTKPIETQISGLKGLDTMTSNSYNSLSAITVQFVASADIESSIQLLRNAVDAAKPNISTDAKDPVVTEVSLDDMPVWSISLTGPYDAFTLRKDAEDIQTELEKIPGIREVDISGGDEQEFEVAYKPDKLLYYGVSVAGANAAIVAANTAIPAGNFDTSTFVVPINSEQALTTADDIASIAVAHSTNGSTVLLKDIADVTETALKKTTYSRLSINGSAPQNAVTLSVIKRQGASVLDTVDTARATVDRMVRALPPGIAYTVVGTDLSKQVRTDFGQLTDDFLLTILLVSTILFLIVGLKEAFVAGLAIPLVFFITFGCLLMLGISLNFLSLFSLILALGLLVDDAIVVVSATKQYLNTGKFTPEEAVLLVLNDFKWVLTTTTLATVWAFLPLLFAGGIIGQYLKSIPITVSITLVASLLVALMVNHPLAAVLERIRLTKRFFFLCEAALIIVAAILFYVGSILSVIIGAVFVAIEVYLILWYERTGRREVLANANLMEREWQDDDLIKAKLRDQGARGQENFRQKLMHGIVNFHLFLPMYERSFRHYILDRKRRRRVLAAVIALFIFSVALVPAGFVKSVFFPEQDSDYVFIDMRAPVGTNLAETDRRVAAVEKRLLGYTDIDNFSTVIGQASPNSGNFGAAGGSAENLASISIILKDNRAIKSYDFADKLRADLASTTGLEISVSTLAGGPPAGAAFEAHISGDDLDQLASIVRDLKPMLSSIPGVVNVNVSQRESVPQYTFELNPVAMEQNGLNAALVGSTLRTAVSGIELTKIVEGDKEVQLIATFDQSSIPDLSAIQNMQILNDQNQPVFLKDVATIELKPAVDVITRIDQKRTIILSAGANSTTNGQAILSEFQKKLAAYHMPAGYSISYGGENEQNQQSVTSVLQAMIIALILIVATLIIQFNSFRKAFIVLVPIPLALTGVFIGMALFNVPLSFPGLIGVLALFGIVVKNAIILVDKINLNIKSGIKFEDAIADAGKSRLEAIFITSICTIIGILPVTLSNELWRSLGGAVIFGLTLSSFLTLYIVPAFYLAWVKDRKQHF
ncbi:MAG: efflux RND transporter permease subunit [Patescibacteria group bacterium]|nr:efflux RND transporter permease subunit [Patescibacteria group bacterium]